MNVFLTDKITKIYWNCSDDSTNSAIIRDELSSQIVLPGYFPMKNNCHIAWHCGTCKEAVTFQFPITREEFNTIQLRPGDLKNKITEIAREPAF